MDLNQHNRMPTSFDLLRHSLAFFGEIRQFPSFPWLPSAVLGLSDSNLGNDENIISEEEDVDPIDPHYYLQNIKEIQSIIGFLTQ